MKDILFVYEKGKWSANGNKLTLTPTSGRGEWWSKAASGRTSEWGSLQKGQTWKLETISYTFELHYFSGVKETHLLLQNSAATEREGKSNNDGTTNSWSYTPRTLDK